MTRVKKEPLNKNTTPKPTAYWLMKSEPDVYSWSQLLIDQQTRWEGVRNYEARNNLRAMKRGDLALFYHSNKGKEIVGVARIKKTHYQDPTSAQDWSVVDVEPVIELTKCVTLSAIKKNPVLAEMALLKKSRLSVGPVRPAEFEEILRLGGGVLPKEEPE
jgi:predicted RNA-binding protein with PUA-like domain